MGQLHISSADMHLADFMLKLYAIIVALAAFWLAEGCPI
jgi:hypothetical protein